MTPTLLVLAAGIGSRYGGLKQVDPVGPGGETLLDYSVYDARRAGFGKVVFVIRRDMQPAFQQVIGARFDGWNPIDYAYQELDALPPGFAVPAGRKKPWGTGHAILSAADRIGEPFAVINADDYYGPSAYKLLGDSLRSDRDAEKAAYCMVGYVLRNTLSEHGPVARGLCQCDRDQYLQGIREIVRIEPDRDAARYTEEGGRVNPLTGNEIVSMNLWGFTPSIFDHLRRQWVRFLEAHGQDEKAEFFIPTVVNTLIAEGAARVKVLSSPDRWFGITYRQDRAEVVGRIRDLVDRRVYPENLWAETGRA